MGRKKLTDIEKAQALTKIGLGVSVIKTAAELKVSRQAVYTLLKSAKGLPEGRYQNEKLALEGKEKRQLRQTIFYDERWLSVHQLPLQL